MTFALARSLLLADAVSPAAMAEALLVSATRGTSLARALLATRAIEAPRLEQQLERGDAPTMRHIAPVMELVQQLPPGLCERLLALPVRRDPRTGTIDVAVVDARDSHPIEEMAHWLRAPVRRVRTSLATMDAALERMRDRPAAPGPRALAAPIWVPPAGEAPRDLTRTPAYGSPAAGRSAAGVDAGFIASAPAAEQQGSGDEGGPTEIIDFGLAGPNIPFVLRRRSVAPPLLDPGTLIHEPEPVLELRRRRSVAPSGAPVAKAPAPRPPLAPALDAIRLAADRDALFELVVAGMSIVARKVAVLAVRKEGLVGWTCSPELGDRAALRAARITPAPSDALQVALGSPAAILARLPKDGTHAPLLAAMNTPPSGEVGLVAVRVDGKPVALLLAEPTGDRELVTHWLDEVARAAGASLERLLRGRRK